MNKPEKKGSIFYHTCLTDEREHYRCGYNEACDDWEKWLPIVIKETEKYVSNCFTRSYNKSQLISYSKMGEAKDPDLGQAMGGGE